MIYNDNLITLRIGSGPRARMNTAAAPLSIGPGGQIAHAAAERTVLKSAIAALCLLGTMMSDAVGASATMAEQWENLRQTDLQVATMMHRLAVANAADCPAQMPATGLVLHSAAQYSPRLRASAELAFHFAGAVSVEAVVPGSAGQAAGIMANDGIVAVNGVELPRAPSPAPSGSSSERDALERLLVGLPVRAPIALTIVRNDRNEEISLNPVPACRTRVELLTGRSRNALSDGETIQIGSQLAMMLDDAGLAVVLAHELAHTMLRHRQMIEAADAAGRSRSPSNFEQRRQFEADADRKSVQILLQAKLDPCLPSKFWRGPGRTLDPGILRSPLYQSWKLRAQYTSAEALNLGAVC